MWWHARTSTRAPQKTPIRQKFNKIKLYEETFTHCIMHGRVGILLGAATFKHAFVERRK